MAYTKVYERINWCNRSDGLVTPLDRINLNKTDYAINELDNRIIEQDQLKANQSTVLETLCNWSIDADTGIITVTKTNGEQIFFDLNVEKIPVSFALSEAGILTMTTEDGTKFTADIGSLIPVLTFETTDTIGVSVSGSGANKVYSFFVKDGSITADKLQPDYLADVTVQAQQAATSAAASTGYENLASYDAKLSQSYAVGGTGIREDEDNDNARYYLSQVRAVSESVSESAILAGQYADKSANAAANAIASADTVADQMIEASEYAAEASNSATQASSYAIDAETSANIAGTKTSAAQAYAEAASKLAVLAGSSADTAADSATLSQSYAVGGTGTRENEDNDNARYYLSQARAISESFAGALRPMGTVLFANLPDIASAASGDMYNISDEFVTTEDFREGSGYTEPAGSNVYKTSDGYWDVLAGSPVTGIKGASETAFRRGNVNLTPKDIGALEEDGIASAAEKLESSAGSATKPVYFSGGKPVACAYNLEKSVPANAVLTDTWEQNTAAGEGYVPATNGLANAFYATNSAGVPGWRDIYPIDAGASVDFQTIGGYAFNVIDVGTYNRSWADYRMIHVRIVSVGTFQPDAETYLKLDGAYYLMIMPGYDAYSTPVVYDSHIQVPRPGDILQAYLNTDLKNDDEGDGGLGSPEYTDAAGYVVCANMSVTSSSSYAEDSDTILATAKAVHTLYLNHCKHSLGTLGTAVQSMVISGQSLEPITIEIVACNSSAVPQAVYAYVAVHDGSDAAKLAANTSAISSTYGTIAASTNGVTIANKSGYYLHVSAVGACSAVIS